MTVFLPAAVDPYAIITCEGERVRSPVQKDTRCPNFDVKGVFYRKKPKDGIHVEVSCRTPYLLSFFQHCNCNSFSPHVKFRQQHKKINCTSKLHSFKQSLEIFIHRCNSCSLQPSRSFLFADIVSPFFLSVFSPCPHLPLPQHYLSIHFQFSFSLAVPSCGPATDLQQEHDHGHLPWSGDPLQ